MGETYDFSGWATRNNIKCSDGRTIMQDAFKNDNGQVRPLVWNHQHNDSHNVLGHALLENRPEGVYAYCTFNDTESGKNAKLLVEHGDVTALSILANELTHNGSNVVHGAIKEVSLVLAGANPGAYIDSVIKHGEESDEEAIIYSGEQIVLYHADTSINETLSHADDATNESENKEDKKEEKEDTNDNKDETVGDIIETMTEKQKNAVYYMIGKASNMNATENEEESANEGGDEMKHNVFDQQDSRDTQEETILQHDAMNAIIRDAKRYGTMKESFLQHAEDYGIKQIDYLFPEDRNVTAEPQFIQRDMGWVSEVMNGTHKTPFSRIKSMFADITEDEARAKGYMKGKLKKEEVFSLLKRTTTPTTVYKKQKMDRDDVIDITDFNVVNWLKTEMRMMLNEEIARAILVGDGRLASSDDKINEQNIRPIWKDEELFTIKSIITVTGQATADEVAQEFIRTAIKSRKDYKGSGTPTLFTTEDFLTDMLLLTDKEGRDLYDSADKLIKKLRVSKIVTVPVMEGLKSSEGNALLGIIVNMNDYNIGADKGGAINMFEDFDIDFNQMKYLIETRCSGALIKPFSAIAIEKKISG